MMLKKLLRAAALASVIYMAFGTAQANVIDLFDWGFNIDGTTWCNAGPCDNDVLFQQNISGPGDLPANVDTSNFDFVTGLGTLGVEITGAGAHNLDLFLDHEIDEAINTFFNEFGDTVNVGDLLVEQSWEIDEPGFAFGDIFDNFLASTLDGTNGVPANAPDDVSIALGWDFNLIAGETLNIGFTVSNTQPSGFSLAHTDPDSNTTIYSNSFISGVPVPEPGTVLLMGIGLLGMALMRRRSNPGSS